jgi:hypothetical protein
MRCVFAIFICFFCTFNLSAQKEKREPLTEAQVEQIREAGIDPMERVKIYTRILDEHAEALKALGKRSKSAARSHRMEEELEDFTALMDELGSNLDTYGDRKADLRKSLKPLADSTQKWLEMLRGLLPEPAFELAIKEAIESGQDLADEASRLLKEQTDYFNLHKDEQGQDRAEPKNR